MNITTGTCEGCYEYRSEIARLRRQVRVLGRVFRAALAVRRDFRDAFARGELPGTQFASEQELHAALETAVNRGEMG